MERHIPMNALWDVMFVKKEKPLSERIEDLAKKVSLLLRDEEYKILHDSCVSIYAVIMVINTP